MDETVSFEEQLYRDMVIERSRATIPGFRLLEQCAECASNVACGQHDR